jgi:hypothetical protein
MSWLKSIFGKDTNRKTGKDAEVVAMKKIDYPPKIILAWAEAVKGNGEIGAFLLNNGYEELFFATQAIKLKNEARDWLMKNGYPHLMAFINAAEGNESAQNWLKVHQMELLLNAALAVEDEPEAWKWLKSNATEDIFILARNIKEVKDQIEFNHNDTHTFGVD